MKKIFAFSIFLFFLSGQISEAKVLTTGIKGGFNLANFRVSPQSPEFPRFKNLSGFTAGLFVRFEFGPFGLQPELLYSRRGTKFNLIIDTVPSTVEYRFDYLEVILLLQWRGFSLGPIRPVIFAGPSYGNLLKATGVIFDSAGTQVESLDIKDLFKKSELAAVFGGGMELKLPRLKLSLEGRYHFGLSNIAAATFEGDFIKNKGYSVLLGASF